MRMTHGLGHAISATVKLPPMLSPNLSAQSVRQRKNDSLSRNFLTYVFQPTVDASQTITTFNVHGSSAFARIRSCNFSVFLCLSFLSFAVMCRAYAFIVIYGFCCLTRIKWMKNDEKEAARGKWSWQDCERDEQSDGDAEYTIIRTCREVARPRCMLRRTANTTGLWPEFRTATHCNNQFWHVYIRVVYYRDKSWTA